LQDARQLLLEEPLLFVARVAQAGQAFGYALGTLGLGNFSGSGAFLVHFLRGGHGAARAGLEQRRRDDLNRIEECDFLILTLTILRLHPHVLVGENVTIGACTVLGTAPKLPWVPLRKGTRRLRPLKALLRLTTTNIGEKLLRLGRRRPLAHVVEDVRVGMPHADAVQIFPAVGGPSRRWVLVLDTAAHDSRLPRSFLVHFLRGGHAIAGAGLEQRRRDDLNRIEKMCSNDYVSHNPNNIYVG